MDYLRYSSDEMFSSTELIRKSKTIFDKLNKKEVEKAIILRDGKPSFMLLDFETYEKIMKEYIQLKESKKVIINEEYLSLDDIEVIQKESKKEKDEPVIENIESKDKTHSEKVQEIDEITSGDIDDEEFKRALEEIEKIEFDNLKSDEKENVDDSFEIELSEDTQKKVDKEPLKEFWD